MKLLIDSGCELMKIDDYSCANLDDFARHPRVRRRSATFLSEMVDMPKRPRLSAVGI